MLSEFHRDNIHCWALPSCPSCIRCLLWSLAQGCLNPTPKLPLPRIHTHGLHSSSLEVGGCLFIPENTHSGDRGGGGVHKYMFLLCLSMVWLCFTEAERKTHFKNVLFVYVSVCMCKHLWLCTNSLGLEEGTGFPGVGVTVSWVGNTQPNVKCARIQTQTLGRNSKCSCLLSHLSSSGKTRFFFHLSLEVTTICTASTLQEAMHGRWSSLSLIEPTRQ